MKYNNFTTTFYTKHLLHHNECICIVDEGSKKASGVRCKTFQRKIEETGNHPLDDYKRITKIQTSKRALKKGIQ